MSTAPAPARRAERLGSLLQRAWAGRGRLSTFLLPLSWLFRLVTDVRRALYARGWLASARLPVPVLVVGNLIVGGAGKTPTVIAVVHLLRARGYVPGIVSRGYGGRLEGVRDVEPGDAAMQVGDEPLLLRRRTGAPVVVARDRVAAGRALLRSHPEVDVVVGDDGLQHLALQRDAEVIVFDERGAGNGRLLPAGPLREPVPRRLGERQVALYNAPAASTSLPGHLARRRLAGAVALQDWWRGEPPALAVLSSLRGRKVLAVAGLARPARFFAMLREHGIDADERALDDHHDFASLPWPPGTGDVILTEKDAVKLPPSRRIEARIWVAALDFEPEPGFASALLSLLPPPRTASLPHDPPASLSHGNPPA
ncbi:MAG TPA: tetraacyldisaccharide 4'-kinase [Caldimonas sp.]|nr:tetraacyldisaccharide 4'-kinase [Caldimonas sp.]HEX2541846.1 tetraacyldisaccharide 4'-kinase [Caldimonas sp.]